MPGTRYPNAEGHPPSPPLQRGEERSEKGGCYPFKGGSWGDVHINAPKGLARTRHKG